MLRGDTVKDDSGAHAVFTDGRCCEITKMCWTSRRRSISLHPVKMEDAPRLQKIQSVSVQIFGDVYYDTSGQYLGQASKNDQWFFLNVICTDTRLQATCGKDSSMKF